MNAEDSSEEAGAAAESTEPDVLEMVDSAAEGVVQWYGLSKGYGFVSAPGVDEDIFVHYSQLKDPDNLMAGDRVRFRLVRTERGLQAQDLEVVAEVGSTEAPH